MLSDYVMCVGCLLVFMDSPSYARGGVTTTSITVNVNDIILIHAIIIVFVVAVNFDRRWASLRLLLSPR